MTVIVEALAEPHAWTWAAPSCTLPAMHGLSDMSRRILDTLREHAPGGLRRSALRRALAPSSREENRAFVEAFKRLRSDGSLIRRRGGRFVPAEEMGLVSGTISVARRGFGFVTPTDADGAPDVFIPPGSTGGAISGDRVLVRIVEEGRERGPVGRVTKVVDRTHSVFIGCLWDRGDHYSVRPLRRELPTEVPLRSYRPEEMDGAESGDWVEVQLLHQDGPRAPLVGKLVRRVAGGDVLTGDLDAVCAEYELPLRYTPADEEAAARATARDIERTDCRELCCLTIDPADAKDFDDALSVRGLPGGLLEVGVHIADVACFVTPGSALDAGARERCFTAYLPGRTLPMLPHPLAATRCSLVQGEDREAHSVFLEIDPDTGTVRSARREHTWIRVRARLNFAEVAAFLDGETDAVPAAAVGALRSLGKLAERMRRQRAEDEQFLDLALPDVKILCTEDPPRILGLEKVVQNHAHRLVEEFMLAANTWVAKELETREIPGIFRVHPEPEGADISSLAEWVEPVLGGRLPALSDRAALNRFLARAADSPIGDTILAQFLMTLPRAGYASSDDGHFGLGKTQYAHFTSPIRRYPDLVVHQQLLTRDLGETPLTPEHCDAAALASSASEETVDRACRAASDRLKLRYVQDVVDRDPGACYEGRVTRLLSDGVLVYMPEWGLMGLLPHEHDRYSSGRHGKTRRCGDLIYVTVRHADRVRGTLELGAVVPRI